MNKHSKKILVNTVVILLILAAIAWIGSIFIHIGGAWTDNAQVHKDIVPVSARVQGFVTAVRFNDFTPVHQGDTLVLIEDAQYRLRLAQARADYENALAGKSAMGTSISATDNNLLVTDAAIQEVNIQLAQAESEYRRYEKLLSKGAVTPQEYERVKTQYEALKAKVETMQLQRRSAAIGRSEQQQRLSQTQAGIDVAEAALHLTELNLGYTVVTAPCDGIASAKQVETGALVGPGSPLLSIVSGKPYIIANYRETQMGDIALGKKVEIKVDALKGERFSGVVSAISDATGAQYSHMAPDNATGNFVKIEQRIPVKISITEGPLERLSAGMNVTCKVLK